MASRRHLPDSATTRPVTLRVRPDLSVCPQQIGGRRYWVVKDPIALTYFHLRDEEHAILQMLDGRTSLAEIKRRFERAFAPLQITAERIQAFLSGLHRVGILLAEAPGQGQQLLLRRTRRRTAELMRSLTGLLAIRLPGIDPEPLLNWLYPKCRWMFSRWSLASGFLLALAAVTLVVVQFDVLQSKLPDSHLFFSGRNVIWLAVALAAAKVMHELGHALCCRHFGGECHEMGILLLVFTPCLYCNVSDSWMLPGKWQRIAITAAGIYVEVILASLCTFLWWFSEPGLLNTICLNMMFVCSVSTVLFNGNPLLRYDGYFILSDLLEVPNLGQQSRALVGRAAAWFFLGVKLPHDRALPETRRGLLVTYGIASTVYRWVIVVAILWFCIKALKPHRLELFAQALAVVVFTGMLAVPARNFASSLHNETWRRRIRQGRALMTCAAVAAALAAACLIPLPFRVTAPVMVQPEAAHRVYVSVPGALIRSLPVGTSVQKGHLLAELENLEVRRQVEELTGRSNRQRVHLENLKHQLVQDPSVGPQIPAAQEALADLEERLEERRRDQQRLILRADKPGVVLPPPYRLRERLAPGQLQQWWGTPLEQRNLGCYLTVGTLFCIIGDPSRLEAVLVIDQSDMTFVRKEQQVRIHLGELPGRTLHGTITEIAKADLKVVPRELATGEELPIRVDEHGVPRPVETAYYACVSLDNHPHELLTGVRGWAKILADPQPLARRLYRYLKHTFRFEL